jgi:integrase/recombinase XerD
MEADARWTLDALIERYSHHCRRTGGLRSRTVRGYGGFVRLFVRTLLGNDPIDLTRFNPRDVMMSFASLGGRFSARSMKTVRTALRSFFRFLRVEGLCDLPLEAALPKTAYWRLSALPCSLDDEELARVLTSFDRSTPYGRRDRAVVVCLATLGLRPNEIAALALEDIDWRAGTIHLRTRKTRRGAVLPLPREAGRAIAAYLRQGRPPTRERCVFVQQTSSRRGCPLSSTAVSAIVARALRRAKVDATLNGAYVFRHTMACRLVRQGASLKEIADFLGHRSLDTTTIYTKLDLTALRSSSLPWPEVTS